MMDGKRKLVVGGVVAGGGMLLAAGLVLGAGVAKATPDEDVPGYLRALVRDQVDSTNTARSIDIGRSLCAHMRSGQNVHQVAEAVAQHASVPLSFALAVATDAHDYLCPGLLVAAQDVVAAQ